MKNANYTHISDLFQKAEPPTDGILSRTLHNDEHVKIVIFGFGAGQELSEHTASMPAVLQVLQGQARLTLGDDVIEAGAGTLVHMAAGLKHAIRAEEPAVVLLMLLKR
ncbi:cupin domain-containing protein [soil metagenome]